MFTFFVAPREIVSLFCVWLSRFSKLSCIVCRRETPQIDLMTGLMMSLSITQLNGLT